MGCSFQGLEALLAPKFSYHPGWLAQDSRSFVHPIFVSRSPGTEQAPLRLAGYRLNKSRTAKAVVCLRLPAGRGKIKVPGDVLSMSMP